MLKWLRNFGEWKQKREGLVEVTVEGFTLHRDGKAQAMKWRAVTQIDVARTPSLVIEDFWVVLFSGEKSIAPYDSLSGFQDFQKAILGQWPEIERYWTKIYTGPPDVEERATLWKQRESY